jgi:RHS repeat-associated protein
MSSLLPRFARLLALVLCGVAALSLVDAGSASARPSKAEEAEAKAHEEFFGYRPEGIEEATAFGTLHLPAGWYLTADGRYPALRVLESGEHECKNAEKDEGCVPYSKEAPPAFTEYLAPHYEELTRLIQSGSNYREGVREATLTNVYAWKPLKRRRRVRHRERFGLTNAATPNVAHPCKDDPVECITGNEVVAQSDINVPALGVPFVLERTYNSQEAVREDSPGLFGYGWSSSFGDHLEFDYETGAVTVVQANGSTVAFFGHIETAGEFTGPSWAQAKLVYAGEDYEYTLPDQETLAFNASGRLLSERERNGNVTTVSYNEEETCEGGCHKVLKSIVVADPAGRKITLTLDASGQVETASDPMGHTVKYAYEGGNLVSVTEPGESSTRWQFKYNGTHEMTELVNGLGGKTTTEYNGSDQVVSQTSPLGDTTHFAYEEIASKLEGVAVAGVASEKCPEKAEESEEECEEDEEVIEPWEQESTYYAPPPEQVTTITNETTGAVEKEHFNSEDELESLTRAYGTANSTTETFTYNSSYEMTSRTDGDKHETEYGYDASGDLTSEKNADGDTTEWEYNSTHDVTGVKLPDGEKATIERDSDGNAIKVSRPAPGETTQATKYKYKSDGELESMTNPLERTWKYEYDAYGDRTSETDPEGNERTWEYNEDSQQTAEVSPRGSAGGAEPSKYTTKTERDAQGRPVKITDPLGHTTKYTYDADGNTETITDGNSHKTTYSYDEDDLPIKIKEANGDVAETDYDAAGNVVKEIDGNKHTWEYVRNILEQVTETVDPLGRKTLAEYDGAGSLVKLTDAEKRTTTYTYDPANRLTEVSYSSGKPATIKYEYNENGDRTKMTDGTGTSTYTFDQLDRMTESESGHKAVVKYKYDLDNDQTEITYPNGKAVTRAFDKDGRLEKVTDWDSDTTKFTYNPDSQLSATIFPSASKDEDTYAYNEADQLTEIKMKKGTETLASLSYTRDNDAQVKSTTQKGLPGTETVEDAYDEDNRLTKAGATEFKYDAANNPTTNGSSTDTFNEADELTKGSAASYTYNELGQRTKTTPTSGPATTYGYDQAGNLISVERPKEGATAEIKDTYAYNGEGLRASETISGSTHYITWQTAGVELPLILSNESGNAIYGPEGVPIEQISSGGTVTYLHHDQQGSTRLLTSTSGTITGKCTYSAYGNAACEGSTTSPFGYDGQYTSSDTGLIYLRNRVYDPATAQFLSVDPLEGLTGEPYAYANDNPVNEADLTGLGFFGELEELGEEVGEGVAGWGDKLTFGLTKKVREAIGDENVDTCSAGYQAGGYAGLATTFFVPGEDDAEAAELGAEGVDEVGNTVTSTTRATPGGDGAESVIIKERGPNGETLQVVHQVGKPLPDGGGTIIIHQHAKYGPLPGSELVFPDVEP